MYKTISKRMQVTHRVPNRAGPLLRGKKDHFCYFSKQWFSVDEYRRHQLVSGAKSYTVVSDSTDNTKSVRRDLRQSWH
jgi:hypothetical protein